MEVLMSPYGSHPKRLRALLAVVAASLIAAASASTALAQSPSPALPTPEEVAALLTDPTVSGPDTSVHYVGQAEDPTVYVAVVDPGDGTVSMYLCDGADVAVWLDGTIEGGAIEATGKDGSTASATLDGETITGTATLADGTKLGITASRAALPAGLYVRHALVDGEPTIARTIQLPDGTARGKASRLKCTNLAIEWLTMMDVYRTTSDPEVQGIAGNKAHQAYVDARSGGCDMSAF
jgi:hypothetical protein